jgi:hypothetical protein
MTARFSGSEFGGESLGGFGAAIDGCGARE